MSLNFQQLNELSTPNTGQRRSPRMAAALLQQRRSAAMSQPNMNLGNGLDLNFDWSQQFDNNRDVQHQRLAQYQLQQHFLQQQQLQQLQKQQLAIHQANQLQFNNQRPQQQFQQSLDQYHKSPNDNISLKQPQHQQQLVEMNLSQPTTFTEAQASAMKNLNASEALSLHLNGQPRPATQPQPVVGSIPHHQIRPVSSIDGLQQSQQPTPQPSTQPPTQPPVQSLTQPQQFQSQAANKLV